MSRVCFCGRPLTWRDLIRSVKNNFVSPAAYLNTHQLGAHSGLVNSSKKGTRPIAAASYQLGLMCTMSWLDGHWAQQGISDSILLMKYAKTYTFVNIWNAGRGILFAHYLKALKTLLYIIISAQQDLKIQWLPNEEGTTQRQHFWQHIDELSKNACWPSEKWHMRGAWEEYSWRDERPHRVSFENPLSPMSRFTFQCKTICLSKYHQHVIENMLRL